MSRDASGDSGLHAELTLEGWSGMPHNQRERIPATLFRLNCLASDLSCVAWNIMSVQGSADVFDVKSASRNRRPATWFPRSGSQHRGQLDANRILALFEEGVAFQNGGQYKDAQQVFLQVAKKLEK